MRTDTCTTLYTGIDPGAGIGTIIEGNQIANCYEGLKGTGATKDLVIWNNFWRNVWKGISFNTGSATTGPIIAQDNIFELSRVVAQPIGIEIKGTTGADRFEDLILRKNIIRQIVDTENDLRSDARGIKISQSKRLIVENNLINDADDQQKPVQFTDCTSVKFFNNQDDTGKLLRGYNTSTGKEVLELEDAVQDVLLPL